jgi:AcrR family transcriptional regulator
MSATAAGTPRDRLIRETYRLLRESGRDAVSVRAVTAAAGVQAPTIYRQFGDLDGLLGEVANYGFAGYLASKEAMVASDDPVADLAHGWDMHIAFGLAEPGIYALMYGDPRPGPKPAAVQQARRMLREIVQRIAEAGRLRASVDQAVEMVDAAGAGVVLHLLELNPAERASGLSAAVRQAMISAVTLPDGAVAAPEIEGTARVAALAVTLKESLGIHREGLSAAEHQLFTEWLDRLSTLG